MAKNYIKGTSKEVTFDNGGSIINVSLNLEQLNSLPSNNGYVQISVCPRRETDMYGNTHYVVENEYKPKDSQKAPNNEVTSKPDSGDDNGGEDDLPF